MLTSNFHKCYVSSILFFTGGDSMAKKKGIFDIDADIDLFKQGILQVYKKSYQVLRHLQ